MRDTQMKKKILVVDNEEEARQKLFGILDDGDPESEYEYDVIVAENLEEAEKAVADKVDLCLIDIVMPVNKEKAEKGEGKETGGFELCRRIRANEETRHIPIIFVTAHHTPEFIQSVFRNDGGDDYISTPFKSVEILKRVDTHLKLAETNDEIRTLVRELTQLQLENAYLQEEIEKADNWGEIIGKREIIGESKTLQEILDQVELVAPTDASVLILGESGTGKELIARAIHTNSQRSKKAMVKVNCGAIPGELFESEFFGHVKGAFTGAVMDRKGKFESADGGTLFLDEVSEIPLELQSKLLRVLQEGQFERVGDDRTREVDVRIIAATNRQLEAEVEAGRFREDLFYRLNVFPITVPPLRQRKGDIPSLAEHFIHHARWKMNRPQMKLTDECIKLLQSYDWPGNVRELQNVIERLVILSKEGGEIRTEHLHLPEVKPATRNAEVDPLGVKQFLDQHCVFDADAEVLKDDLTKRYEKFCNDNGIRCRRNKFYDSIRTLYRNQVKDTQIDGRNAFKGFMLREGPN